MKPSEIKNLVKRISKGKGVLSLGASSMLNSLYTKEKGIEVITTVYSQIQDDVRTARNMFDEQLIKDICNLPFTRSVHTSYNLQLED
jgi:hypothetical protein